MIRQDTEYTSINAAFDVSETLGRRLPLPAAPGERRGAPRRRTLLSAKLVGNSGWMVLDCTIRDLSASGANIVLGGGVLAVPGQFDLHLANGAAYSCEVVRVADEKSLCVRFLDIKQAPPSPGTLN